MARNERPLCFIGAPQEGFFSRKSIRRQAERYGLKTATLTEEDILSDAFNPESVFITSRLKSAAAMKLLERKCWLVGPQVIDWCMEKEKPLPRALDGRPILNTAMHGIVVSCTNVPMDEREKIYGLVRLMGGQPAKDLSADVTHLVAGSVLSEKYRVAVGQLGIPVMASEWVTTCWKESKKRGVAAGDEEFLVYRCPCFHGCQVCVTGIEERLAVKRLVEENGGKYSGELDKENCTHLVAGRKSGDKYEFAQKWEVTSVSPQWLYDSVEAGVCLDEAQYPVVEAAEKTKKVSRPKTYLTGCRVMLDGNEDADQQLKNIVLNAGGTVSAVIDGTVTHIIATVIGGLNNLKQPTPFLISPQWLLDCSKERRKLAETDYELDIHTVNDIPSEETKAVHAKGAAEEEAEDHCDNDDDPILKQYLVPGEETTVQIPTSMAPTSSGPLSGKSFSVFDVSDSQASQLQKEIRGKGGSISTSIDTADALIVSIDSGILSRHSSQLVLTTFWFAVVVRKNQWVSPDDHPLYRPIAISDDFKPFRGLVFSISQFEDDERNVLTNFVELLGGLMQQYMLKQDSQNERMKRTTHLLLKSADGAKYVKTADWGIIPASMLWPIECARQRKRLPEDDFIIGKKSSGSQRTVSSESSPLSGVVLFVTKKLAKQQIELHNIASSLGADHRYVYDSTCTHVVHQGRLQDGGRELRLARENGAAVVSPHWLYACRDTKSRADEAEFPHTYNPRMSLTGVATIRRGKSAARVESQHAKPTTTATKSTVEAMGMTDDLLKETEMALLRPSEEDHESPDNQEFSRQVDQLISETKGRRPTFHRRLSVSSPSGANEEAVEADSEKEKDGDESDEKNNGLEPLMKPTVVYENPSGRAERERILAHMKGTTSRLKSGNGKPARKQRRDDSDEKNSAKRRRNEITKQAKEDGKAIPDRSEDSTMAARMLSNTDEEDFAVTAKRRKMAAKSQTPPPPDISPVVVRRPAKVVPPVRMMSPRKSPRHTVPHFLMTGINRREKDDYAAVLESLGGKFHDTDCFVSSATHLIAARPTRSEKFLAMMAAGKWILHKSFIEASREEGRYVKEEEHEWGGVAVGVNGKAEREMASAAHRWRVQVAGGRGGAFNDWKVLLAVNSERQAGVKRLLEAGGARVLSTRTPFAQTSINQATVAFVDRKLADSPSVGVTSLQGAGISCLQQDYIADYLIQENPPEKQRYLVQSPVGSTRKKTRLMSPLTLSKRNRKS
eukprot:m.19150 g.19150  ORF g.19150 m.19150 type:complete len:1238 (+) comp27800_c0_seq1:76-3789(+)